MEHELIGIASDHAGYELKQFVKQWLDACGRTYKDFGAYSTESSDYADYAHPLAFAIARKECCVGIAICGSGNGINMALNHHTEIRAALCWQPEIAHLARLHNDANILVMPGRFVDELTVARIMEQFFDTEFEGGRHQCRIDKIPVSND